MKTSIMKSNGARDSTEERVTKNWAVEYAKREMSKHRTSAIIDHPDESITTEKIADRSITTGKLSLDILKEITKIPEFLYYEAEPVYLSGCEESSLGYELPADIPVNVLFILENDTDSSLSEFRTHDDYYTPLSCKIPSGETRICILLKRASGGAEPQNGYLFVLDDVDTQKLISKETSERKNADTTLQQNINTEAANRQTADNALQQKITAEITARENADNALDGRVKSVEDMAHTHANKTVLDGISETDIAIWNGIKEQVTQTQLDAVKAYLEELCFGFSNEFQRIYTAIGVTVYDGGIFGMEQSEIALDGGDFMEGVTGNVDCGGFEPIIISTETGAVIDGGEY